MPTIGRATIDVNYKGDDLPRQARELGKTSGEEFGDEFAKSYGRPIDEKFKQHAGKLQKQAEKDGQTVSESYSKGFTKDLDKLADKVAAVFRDKDGFENYRKNLVGAEAETGKVAKASAVLRQEIRQLASANKLGEFSLRDLGKQLTLVTKEHLELEQLAVAKRLDDEAKAYDKAETAARGLNHALNEEKAARADQADFMKNLRGLYKDLGDDQRENARLQKEGESRTRDITSAMRDLDRAVGDLHPRLKLSNDELRNLKTISGGGTASDFTRLAGAVRKTGGEFEEFGEKARKGKSASDLLAPSVGKLARSFSQFDPTDNPGQLLAILIALAPQVAVLANAAAGGIVILAGAIAALGAAGVGYGLVFSNLFGDLKKVDPAIRPAAKALQDFKKTFGDLRTDLQKQVLTPAVVSQFQQFSTKLAGTLQSGFAKIGPALNQVLLGVSRDLNSAGFKKDFDALFASFAPTIKSFGGILRNTFGIVGELLTQAAPYVQRFVGEVEKASGKFLAFLKTPEGKTAIKDFLDNATRTLKDVGDAAVVVGGALAKLITPKNIENTAKTLESLAKAAPGILKLADSLNEVVPAVAAFLGAIGDIAGGIGEAFEGAFTFTDSAVVAFSNFFTGIIGAAKAWLGVMSGIFGSIGKAFGQALNNDFAGAASTLKQGYRDVVSSSKDFANNLLLANNDAAGSFRTLDSGSRTALVGLATRFGVPQAKVEEFGGKIANLARGAGVSLADIASSKSWNDIQSKTGATGTTVGNLAKEFGKIPAVKSTKVSADGAEESETNVGKLNKQIKDLKSKIVQAKEEGASDSSVRVEALKKKVAALQSKKIEIKEQGAADSASRARILKEKVDALRAKTIQVNETGAAASAVRTQTLDNKVKALKAKTIQVNETGANASSGRVQTLTGKITNLKGKTVNVAANVAGAAAVGALAGAIGALRDKTVNVRTIQSTRNANRYGGVMKAGRQIAGGERIDGGRIAYAAGGILTRPTLFGNVLAGEAGPEAIVPLSGALGRVDKSVRDLAAYARGKTPASAAAGPQRQVVVQSGAIVVASPSSDGRQVASSVLDRLSIAVGAI